jgi:endonuclease-3
MLAVSAPSTADCCGISARSSRPVGAIRSTSSSSRAIQEREGHLDLSLLRGRSDADARDYLTSLPGVGPKTAAIVLAFSLDRSAFPVDTHVHRVASRLGLVPPKSSAARAQDILETITPVDIRVAMHVGLIRLGREICKPGRPRCEVCPLADLCPTAPTILGGKPRGRA